MAGLLALSLLPLAAPARTTVFGGDLTPSAPVLDIYSSTDTWAMQPVIEDFLATRPGWRVRYVERTANELHEHYLEAAGEGSVRADLLISSAMDLQIKLVNDGYAQAHFSEVTSWLPDWAHWRDRAFGLTFEPAVIVYDPARLAPEDVPRTRFDLIRLLREQPERFRGRVGTYDIVESGVGYLFATQDSLQSSTYGRLIESFGRTRVRLECCTLALFEAIERGELLLGYNLLGSYARARIEAGSRLRMVLPEDYTLVLSRVALIPKAAPDPELGAAFLDYVLSVRGQSVLARSSSLYAIHPAVTGEGSAASLRQAANGPLRPIDLGPGLLVFLDDMQRQRFTREWRSSVYPAESPPPPPGEPISLPAR
jgi:two-component system sensor histidine kinase TctE